MQAQLPVIKIPGSDYNATSQREAFLTQAFFSVLVGWNKELSMYS